jgi:hypothetical protein
MSRGATDAARRFMKSREEKYLENAKALRDDTIVRENAARKWEILKEAFSKWCLTFNKTIKTGEILSIDDGDPLELKISRTDTQQTLTMSFLSPLNAVVIEGIEGLERPVTEFKLEVIRGTSDVGFFLQDSKCKGYTKPEAIAGSCLEKFLNL